MRRRSPHRLRMIVGNINVVAIDQQNIFVRTSIRTVSHHRAPGLAKISGLGHRDHAFVVLQPGSVNRPAIHRINLDLHVNLA